MSELGFLGLDDFRIFIPEGLLDGATGSGESYADKLRDPFVRLRMNGLVAEDL